jgi:integrase
MGLKVECPQCKYRNGPEAKTCKCGVALSKFSGRVWWIEFYQEGQRKRERIGPNKAAAKQRLRELLSARAEGRYIKKNPDAKTAFRELATWYLDLVEVKAKRSYDRDRRSIGKMLPIFGDKLLKDIGPALVESYKHQRLNEQSYRDHLTKPATVNRELACLKTIFSKAMRNGKAEVNPTKGVKLLKENNERKRVLSQEEYLRLLSYCPEYLVPIVKTAYYTGMRRGEILKLTWDKVDLQEGFLHLQPEDCKTDEGRDIPLTAELVAMLKAVPRGLPGIRVFTRDGEPINCVREGFESACRKAGIADFTFHDLRHTFINNKRLEGHDYFRIMAATGHKTLSVFKRYNTVTRKELRALVEGTPENMDTNMDTMQVLTSKSVRQ